MRNILASSLRLVVLACLLVFVPNHSQAAVGDNCAVNIANSYPTDLDWRNAYIIQGEDGSAWQRAVINKPQDRLEIQEGEVSRVIGTARPRSEVQVFVFSPTIDASGKLVPPTDANCFDAGITKDEGYFELPVNARSIWANLGQEIAIDAFYRMEKSWDQLKSEQTNQSFFIGTHMSMTKVLVTPVFNNGDDDDDDTGNNGDDDDDDTGNNGDDDDDDTGNNGGDCGTARGGFLDLGNILDPARLSAKLKGDNFAGVQEKKVAIGRLNSGLNHTFYGGLEGGTEPVAVAEVMKVSLKMIVMEGTKRFLMGNPNVTNAYPSIKPINAQALIDAANGTSNVSGEIQNAAAIIRDLMIGDTALRQQKAMEYISFFYNGLLEGQLNMHPLLKDPDFYLELFPANASTEGTWASDYITMLEFWTGSTQQSHDALYNSPQFDLNYVNALIDLLGANLDGWCPNYPEMDMLHGSSPRIVINPSSELELEPKFDNVRLVYADKQFDTTSSWILPADQSTEIYYEYARTAPLAVDPIAEYCLSYSEIPDLVQQFQQQLSLRDDEAGALLEELQTQLPRIDERLSISLLNPADVASVFAWQGNGQQLDIQQLFFRYPVKTCSQRLMTGNNPLLPNPNRDGFETGFLYQ